jgi:hypothetical protein
MTKRKPRKKGSLTGGVVIVLGVILAASALSQNSSPRTSSNPTRRPTSRPTTAHQTQSPTNTIELIATQATASDSVIATSRAQADVVDTALAVQRVLSPTASRAKTYTVRANANARACPRTTCDIVARLAAGTAVSVLGTTTGDSVNGNSTWMHIRVQGQEAYVHSSLLTEGTPRPSSSSSGRSITPQPTVPGQQSTVPPAQPPVVQPTSAPPASSWNCGGDNYNCGDFSTCSQAKDYFNSCPGDPSKLDGDNDGIPCNSLCS